MQTCVPPSFPSLKECEKLVRNTTEEPELLKRARPLVRKYISRLGKQQAKKLVKVYFNGRTVDKDLKLDWESQVFLWDESEPGADRNE